MLIGIELWETAACGKGPTICIVYLMVVCIIVKMNAETTKTKSWHVLSKSTHL